MVGTLSNTKDGGGNMTITVEANEISNPNILKQSPTEISDSTEILEGAWSQTEFAEPDSISIAKYVTKIALPVGYNKAPVVLLKDEGGFLYNMPARVYDGYLYIYTNITPSSGEIIIKL